MVPKRKLLAPLLTICLISFITCSAFPQPGKNSAIQYKITEIFTAADETSSLCEPDPCPENSACTLIQNDGQYKCECKDGYNKTGDDLNPICEGTCALCPINSNCTDESGPICECPKNLLLQQKEDGSLECVHICKTNQHGCQEHSTCIAKEDDSYECKCNEGFTQGGDLDCMPKTYDEMHCESNGKCNPGEGLTSPSTCECEENFVVDGEGCSHICSTNQHGCPDHSECIRKSIDSSTWSSECDDGFIKNNEDKCVEMECLFGEKKVGGKCVPKTCEERNLTCPQNQQCMEPGSNRRLATCECVKGFHVDKSAGDLKVCVIDTCDETKCGPNQECKQDDPNSPATCQCKSGFTTVTVKGITACIRDICSVADLNCGENGSKQPILDDNGNEVGCECQCNEGWKGDKCNETKVRPSLGICDQLASCPSSDPHDDQVLNQACRGSRTPTNSNPCPNCAEGFELKEGKCVPKNPCDGVGDSIICKRLDERIPGNYTFCPRGFENKKGMCVKTIETCSPIIASEAGCEQDCTVELDTKSSKGYKVTCKCFNGYRLSTDGKKCEMNPNGCDDTVCKAKDQHSLCVTDSNDSSKSTCQCQRGFVRGPNDKCVDYCQPDQLEDNNLKDRIKKEIRSICGATIVNCTSQTPNFQRCPDCPPDHERNITTGFCDMVDPCNPGGIGVESCQVKGNKVCRRDIASVVAPLRSAFKCACDGGLYMDTSTTNNPCIDQEKVEKFKKKCSNEGKVPKKRLTNEEPDCICANPTHVNIRNADGHYKCKQPEYSIMIHNLTFSLKIDNYTGLVKTGNSSKVYEDLKLNCDESPDPEGCSRYQALMEAEEEQQYYFYNDLQREEVKMHAVSVALKWSLGLALEGLTVTEFLLQELEETETNRFNSKLLVVTKEQRYGTQLAKKLGEECVGIDLNEGDSCVLNEIIIYDLNGTIIRRYDECADDATPHRRCKSVGEKCECTCDSGFEPSDPKVKDRDLDCIDIDECKTGVHQCPSDSQCVNTIGSYQCKCNEGMKQTSSLPPDGIGKCEKGKVNHSK